MPANSSAGAMAPELETPSLSQDPFYDAVLICNDKPDVVLECIKKSWDAGKGSLIGHDGALCSTMFALSACFRRLAGCVVPENFSDFPQDEYRLWKTCISFELPLILLEMTTDELFFEQPFNWINSVLVLNAAMANNWVLSGHPGMKSDRFGWPTLSPPAVDAYFQKIGAVWDVLWRERKNLLYTPKASWSRRIEISAVIVFAHSVTNLYARVYPARRQSLIQHTALLAVSLAAWTQVMTTSPYPDHQLRLEHASFAFTVAVEFRNDVWKEQDAGVSFSQVVSHWRDMIDPSIEAIGPLKFMRACLTALLSWPEMVSLPLVVCLQALLGTVEFYTNEIDTPSESDLRLPSRRAYWAVPMLHGVSEALERNSRVDDSMSALHDSGFHVALSNAGCDSLCFTLQGLHFCADNPPVVDGRSVYQILSHCLRMLGYTLDAGQETGKNSVASAIETFDRVCSMATKLCRGHRFPTPVQNNALRRIVQGLKTSAQESWYADMHSVRSVRDGFSGDARHETLVRSWILFGEAIGLVEVVERDKYEKRRQYMCGWLECSFHSQPSPTSLSTCAGCGERKYCSRECQRSDWKKGGHRERCRRVNV